MSKNRQVLHHSENLPGHWVFHRHEVPHQGASQTEQELFYQLMDCVIEQKDIPLSEEVWLRKPYTRKQLNDLALVTDNMSDNEVLRRIRAMNFPGAPGAYRIINGSRITLS